MKDLVNNLKNLEAETFKNLRSSKSDNTIRAYKADFEDFKNFCVNNKLSYMPSIPKVLAIYLTHLSKNSRFSTLKRRLASIKIIHRSKGHYLDIKHPLIVENLLGIKRKIGSFQRSKKPILINDLKLIIKAINQSNEKFLKKLRDKTLVLVGFAGGFRRSEIVALERNDIEFVSEGVKIFIKRSKTDQSGEGMTKAIPYFINEDLCPVTSLKSYINQKNIIKGKIFGISDKSVALIIKKYANLAGLEMTKYSGHSLRSGFATSTAEMGAEERSIMAMTGHKSNQMVRRYIREADLFKNNALNKLKI